MNKEVFADYCAVSKRTLEKFDRPVGRIYETGVRFKIRARKRAKILINHTYFRVVNESRCG